MSSKFSKGGADTTSSGGVVRASFIAQNLLNGSSANVTSTLEAELYKEDMTADDIHEDFDKMGQEETMEATPVVLPPSVVVKRDSIALGQAVPDLNAETSAIKTIRGQSAPGTSLLESRPCDMVDDGPGELQPQLLLQRSDGDEGFIDSALLSAVKDTRERRNVLRLEQLLVDFLSDKNLGFIQVGGVPIGGGSAAAAAIQSQSMVGGSNNPALQNSLLAAKIQTSFQRLCLHRLADRFGVAREIGLFCSTAATSSGNALGTWAPPSISSPPCEVSATSTSSFRTPPPSIQGSASGFVMHPIRLVKTKSSRIPSPLLIDLNFSSSGSSEHSTVISDNKVAGEVAPSSLMHDLCKSFSSSSSLENSRDVIKTTTNGYKMEAVGAPAAQAPLPASCASAPVKMKIMKRCSSLPNGRGGPDGIVSGAETKAGRNRIRGKKLSDKEKAYAEARARIFAADKEEDFRENDTLGIPVAVGCADSDLLSFDQEGNNCSVGADNRFRRSSESQFTDATTNYVELQMSTTIGDQIGEGASSYISSITGPAGAHRHAPGIANTNAADRRQYSAAGGAVSKVTWRNRRQEESDPDFRRRRGNMGVIIPVSAGLPLHAGYAAHSAVPVNHGGAYDTPCPVDYEYQQQMHESYYCVAQYGVDGTGRGGSGSSSGISPARGSSTHSNHVPTTYYPQQQQMYYQSHPASASGDFRALGPPLDVAFARGTGYFPSAESFNSDHGQVSCHEGSYCTTDNKKYGGSNAETCWRTGTSADNNGSAKNVYNRDFPALR